MKVKLYQILNTKESYDKLSEQSFLPISLRFSLSEDAEIIQNQLQRFDKFKIELIKKYGEVKEDGSVVVPPNTVNMNKFLLEINELGQVDVELTTEKIPEELLIVEECTLNGKDFFNLRGIFLEPRVKKTIRDEKKEDVIGDIVEDDK